MRTFFVVAAVALLSAGASAGPALLVTPSAGNFNRGYDARECKSAQDRADAMARARGYQPVMLPCTQRMLQENSGSEYERYLRETMNSRETVCTPDALTGILRCRER